MTTLQITDRELATVLAALRYWQQDLDKNEILDNPPGYHFEDHGPLSVGEIDDLCDKINFYDEEEICA